MGGYRTDTNVATGNFKDPGLERLFARVMLECRLSQLPPRQERAIRVTYGIGEAKAKDVTVAAERVGMTPLELRQHIARGTRALINRPSLAAAA